MKVIEEGKFKLAWTALVSCKKCEAKLEIEEGDVKPVDYGNGYHCACEVCGENIVLSDADLPLRIRAKCDKKRKFYYSDD